MERWRRPRYRGRDAVCAAPVALNGYRVPSFSSSLLDAIDRSIDKGADFGARRQGATSVAGGEAVAGCARRHAFSARESADAKGAHVYGRGADDGCFRRRAAEHDQRRQHHCSLSTLVPRQRRRDQYCVVNSTSSSSESSYGGFSSSEAESAVLSSSRLPRPIRTGAASLPTKKVPDRHTPPPEEESKQKGKGSVRSRFRASTLYGELIKKRSSAPVSPGARLASFLNTLFSAAGNPKKAKISTLANAAVQGGRGGDDSTCSSASSYTRSCLSCKTPSSRGRAESSGSSTKRSVRFCPVSVILDEDCRPCGQKCLREGEKPGGGREPPPAAAEARSIWPNELPLMGNSGRWEPAPPSHVAAVVETEERKRAREAAVMLVGSCKGEEGGLDGFVVDEDDEAEEEDEEEDADADDDAASYSSSDLFELKSLAAAGCGGEVRYTDELPVYETTRPDANRAVTRGLTV